jgi:glycerophosphoryl diester phosphodiesterase
MIVMANTTGRARNTLTRLRSRYINVRPFAWFVYFAIFAISLIYSTALSQSKKKILVAHRGASAYAPEHTLESYRLAIEQRADFVEQDLQITKDNVLVCLHDLTLERTTNVEEIFPERYSKEAGKHWYVSDFTLAEIKQLDAGSWFDGKFKGAKVPTWQEAIDLIRGKAGLYPETKTPEVYGKRGFDMEKLVIETLKRNRLETPNADPKTPVIIQSFSPESLTKLRSDLKVTLPLVLLISSDQQNQWLSVDGMRKARSFANGIGPAKELVDRNPQIVRWAHEAGLTVTPYTFRSSSVGRFQDVREEMRHYLFTLGVDAVFTDNPDQFPKE